MLLLAVLGGLLGAWIVLRELAFYTHAIGTSALPGLVVAGPWGLPLACELGLAGGVERLTRTRRVDRDAAVGLLLVAALAVAASLGLRRPWLASGFDPAAARALGVSAVTGTSSCSPWPPWRS